MSTITDLLFHYVEWIIIATLLDTLDIQLLKLKSEDRDYLLAGLESLDKLFNENKQLLIWNTCKSKIEKEVEALGKITFKNLSLWEFCKEKDLDKLALMSQNETVKNILTEPDFKEKYLYFGDNIQINFQKGLARARSLETAFNSIVTYNKGPRLLPEECWKKILKKLDQESLKNVTKSIFFKEASSLKETSSLVFRPHQGK